ncbi:type II toxin-antitoxin system VapC family toxin [Actinokineospora xionganensis]|uniref:Ribonuclease VapC n=1 Tax=Actinokineospora xionganensis TaxID=2684470 RepID=A0ABR7L2R0_9PSEU|nr:PIN domain-containing protein [Actinokineospora xionganensis]MBC6446964.1 PIN domain-containing protein [Actinokineospora xionganensis]
MTNRLPKVVVDSCVIVDFLTGNDRESAARARWIFEKHNDEHTVLLPAVVLAEVPGCGVINGDEGGAEERAARIKHVRLWLRDCGFLVAELSERLAREAGILANAHKLKGPDATVLATAIAWQCPTLYTRDHSLLRVDGKYAGLSICAPSPVPEPDPPPQNLFSGQD